jgi:hypothetical protein
MYELIFPLPHVRSIFTSWCLIKHRDNYIYFTSVMKATFDAKNWTQDVSNTEGGY